MRKELKEKLDQEAKNAKKRKLLVPLLAAAGFLLLILLFMPFFPTSISNIQGVSVELSAKQTEEGSISIMMVKLETGVIVKASMPRKLKFIKGAKVNILRNKSIIGTYSYQVLGYEKPNT